MCRSLIADAKYGDSRAQLTVPEEMTAGVCGGLLSSWNHPFEVCRIEAQSRAVANEPAISMVAIMYSKL